MDNYDYLDFNSVEENKRSNRYMERMLDDEFEYIKNKLKGCNYCGEPIDINRIKELVVGAYYVGKFDSDNFMGRFKKR